MPPRCTHAAPARDRPGRGRHRRRYRAGPARRRPVRHPKAAPAAEPSGARRNGTGSCQAQPDPYRPDVTGYRAAVHEGLVLLVALLICYLPGLALMAALGVRSGVLLMGLAPAVSVGVAVATGVGTAILAVPFGATPLGVVTAVMLAVAAGLEVRRRSARGRHAGRERPATGRMVQVVGAMLVAGGIAASAYPWLRGIGPLATVPQEHDMVVHAVLAAYIQRSGHAAPWQLLPADVLTGAPVVFYPSGLHLLVAVTGDLTGATVPALNAVTVVVLAVALSLSAAALTMVAARQLRLARPTAMLAAGVAAPVAAGPYPPALHLMHDGG